MTDQTQANAAAQSETVEVDDLDMFVKLLTRWHGRAVKRTEHLLQVPEGQEVQVGDDPPFKLKGDTLRGFQLGVNMALMELGRLPFTAEMEVQVAVDG